MLEWNEKTAMNGKQTHKNYENSKHIISVPDERNTTKMRIEIYDKKCDKKSIF